MKKLTIILSSVLFVSKLFSQSDKPYNPFKVDLSIGYALPSGNGAKGGGLIVVEPKYSFRDNLSVGLRIETALMVRGLESSNMTGSFNTEVKAAGSYVATVDYYVTSNRSFRPFIGTGFGLYRLASATVGTSSLDVSTQRFNLGAMFRTGFEANWFRLGLEYNLLPNSTSTYQTGTTTVLTYKNSYIGIKLGVCFGEKKMKPKK